MIQRKQTLFLFQVVFLGIALLFVPNAYVNTVSGSSSIYLIPVEDAAIHSTSGHLTAIILNFFTLILASVTVFIYKRRELQIKLCWLIMALWLIVSLMMGFCTFILPTEGQSVERNYFSLVIGLFGIVATFIAARFIKKDIELLKSADRIR